MSTGTANHDRRIPIPGFDAFGMGRLDSTSTAHLVAATGWKSGAVTTGNSLDHSPTDDEVMEQNDASIKDMEAAAIADVCRAAEIPFFAIKVITDIVDGGIASQEEFLENLGKAADSLQTSMPKLLDFLDGKLLDEL